MCFLIRSFSTEVAGAWMSSLPAQIDKPNALDVVTAVLCVADVPAKSGTVTICDAFVGGASPAPTDDDIDRLAEHMEDALLAARTVTPAQVKKALHRHNVDDYLASRKAVQV